jgi:hypothetical protein
VRKSEECILAESGEVLQDGLGVPPLGLDALEPAKMSSSLSCLESDVGVAAHAVQRHRGVADDGVVLRDHDKRLQVESAQFFLGDGVLVENLESG